VTTASATNVAIGVAGAAAENAHLRQGIDAGVAAADGAEEAVALAQTAADLRTALGLAAPADVHFQRPGAIVETGDGGELLLEGARVGRAAGGGCVARPRWRRRRRRPAAAPCLPARAG
jgi:hypothetical protein